MGAARTLSALQCMDAERLRLVLRTAGNANLWCLLGLIESFPWHQVCEGFLRPA